MKTNENQWKSTKINEQILNIHENQRTYHWKSTNKQRKLLKINEKSMEIHRKSMKISEHEVKPFFNLPLTPFFSKNISFLR